MNALSRLSTLTAMLLTVLLLSACEDEPEQTQERLDEAIGQREVQDLFRNEDEEEEGDLDSDQRDEREEEQEQE